MRRLPAPSPPLNGTFDIVSQHIFRLGGPRSRLADEDYVRFTASGTGGHGDFLNKAGKNLPRFASVAPFLCLIVAHFEWPDMENLAEYFQKKLVEILGC